MSQRMVWRLQRDGVGQLNEQVRQMTLSFARTWQLLFCLCTAGFAGAGNSQTSSNTARVAASTLIGTAGGSIGGVAGLVIGQSLGLKLGPGKTALITTGAFVAGATAGAAWGTGFASRGLGGLRSDKDALNGVLLGEGIVLVTSVVARKGLCHSHPKCSRPIRILLLMTPSMVASIRLERLRQSKLHQ